MQFEQPYKIWIAIRKHPARTLGSVAITLVLVVFAMWGSGYLGELGRQSAETGSPGAGSPEAPESSSGQAAKPELQPDLPEVSSGVDLHELLTTLADDSLTALQKFKFRRRTGGQTVYWEVIVREVAPLSVVSSS